MKRLFQRKENPSSEIMRTISSPIICGLLGLLSSCSTLGLYTTSDLKDAETKAVRRGVQQGRAFEARASLMQDQAELEKPRPESNYYEVPVPAHVNSDGVRIEAHKKTVKIVTQ
jgi:hypothetical protein